MDTPEKQAVGHLLERLRNAAEPPLSMRAAAKLAGMSDGRWRQVENGYQVVTEGQVIATVAPPQRLARMVGAIGGTPEDLEAVGREDAAEALRRLLEAAEEAQRHREEAERLRAQASESDERWISTMEESWWKRDPDAPKEALYGRTLEERLADAEYTVSLYRVTLAKAEAEVAEIRRQLAEQPRLSVVPDKVDDLVAADEQDQPISGEAESPTEP